MGAKPSSKRPRTLVEKIWDEHVVSPEQSDTPAVLYADLHLIHEVTSPQAFAALAARGLHVRRPDRTIATADHSIPTLPGTHEGRLPITDAAARAQLDRLSANCREYGIRLYGQGHDYQGIVHVIGPELGLTQPGMTIVCGDSHTSTHGALGALAFGIGTSEVSHVLATQCLLQRKPRFMEVRIDGTLPNGVSAKDVILAVIAQVGVAGGAGHVFEYRGRAVEALTIDQRLTLCNMSIEAGARAGLVAPDDVTFEYLSGRPEAPQGAAWEAALTRWRDLPSDEGARWDRSVTLEASRLAPMITYGTTPAMAMPIDRPIPEPAQLPNQADRQAVSQALRYMALEPGRPLIGHPVDVVFVGSCTNSRLDDLRDAARLVRGRSVADGVRMLVVPGSQEVKRAAEAEGLHHTFLGAGAEWREPGCSMCIAMNGDMLEPGQYAVSTSNRNFEGRQGRGSRTFLASPATAAAAAVTGRVTDPRTLIDGRPA
ncbi:MAG: 3-isopropylmalate dehydratase large subunit [Gemmatimonadales bacterium]|nr:3-isopropylmalate dehydratase large subunit [Gemmatimonadales bacterium]